ncbi:menaquinone-dependent protoporphyrinogen IX dehydrogenase [Thorsellia anophelis]|uniref:Protoporphyrinogen IX dehydrogenase [quinone] n=1 Tax=Thorsellia anophelis DSM 18579 TaxID=1123402 RepID=A0A1I0F293_9GAMM|nr:menaquinone-dependent protoporphyrinogen IX dehydrogenase [Thorsellia anophelis]SET51321.1 menaquinone-dependent protoporphyrinogen oxidase [Thorsellia anophelis DSM 18579]
MKILIIYSTTDGHTKKIAETMGAYAIGQLNLDVVQVIDIKEAGKVKISDYTHVVIGASIRYGKFNKLVYDFIDVNSDFLNEVKSAFFSVNLTARKFDKNTPETNVYTKKFLNQISWRPSLIKVFAGALLYPRYGLFDKFMIKLIMKITKGETDTTKEIDYTDWKSVDEFIKKISSL